jgi:uncharacterized membrane protein
MAPYHVMLVHFPIALWTTAALVIALRTFSDCTVARSADRVLTPLLFIGAVSGALAFAIGLLVWPFEAAAASPLARNHMLLAAWSLAYWTLLWIVRWQGGERVWQGAWRWIMLGLAGLGIGLQTIAGTLGGYLAGNPSMVSDIVRRLGWEVFTTFYVPDSIIAALIVAAIVLAGAGVAGARSATAPAVAPVQLRKAA